MLDSGVMSEFGAPSDLLANEGGSFRSLWDRHQKSHEGDEIVFYDIFLFLIVHIDPSDETSDIHYTD